MAKKIGKQRKDFIENEVYLELLREVNNGNNYSQKIFDSIGKPTSIVCRQLSILEKSGLLSSRVYKENVFPLKKIRIYKLTSLGRKTLHIGLRIKEKEQEILKLKEVLR